MPVNFVFAYARPVAQRYWQRRAWKVSLLGTIWKYSTCPQVTVKRRKGNYASFSMFSNILQNVLSKRIACQTLLQSLQLLSLPWSHKVALPQIVTYAVVKKGMEKEGKQRYALVGHHDVSQKLQGLAKRHISGWNNVEHWRNQAHKL